MVTKMTTVPEQPQETHGLQIRSQGKGKAANAEWFLNCKS